MRFTSRHVTVATRAMNARLIRRGMACVVALVLAVPPLVPAQTGPPPVPFKAEELDQLAAPIALYPDPLVAQARIEGYRGARQATPVPYQGYYYRIVTAQGADALDGAYDYLAHGRMIGGFALVAFPAQYGVSGVMTFIVNHGGVVYQKDLGPNTAAIARGLRLFNPDGSWKKA
jgi:hypothetical protein